MDIPISRPIGVTSANNTNASSVSSASAYVTSLSLTSGLAPSVAQPAISPSPALPASSNDGSSSSSSSSASSAMTVDDLASDADSTSSMSLSEERFRWEGAWERSWEKVDPSAADSSSTRLAVQRLRKSLLSSSAFASSTSHTVVEKGMLRNLYICIDVSPAMDVNDLRPSRKVVTLKLLREFLREFFDENPLASVGFFLCYQRSAERISDLKGSPSEQLAALEDKIRNLDKKRKITKESAAKAKENPAQLSSQPPIDEDISLEALLRAVQQSFESVPPFATKEALLILSSLSTVDDGDIYQTMQRCVEANICVNIISLSAEMFLCRELCQRTNGSYHIVLTEDHYRKILFSFFPPSPIPLERSEKLSRKWIRMGFPAYIMGATHTPPSYCSCHGEYRPNGYVCPRCYVKVCELPTVCSVCGMMLIKAAHLAKTYHHLFPPPEYAVIEEKQKDGVSATLEREALDEKKESGMNGAVDGNERMQWEGPIQRSWQIDSANVSSSSAALSSVETWSGECFACRKPLSSLTDLRIRCEKCAEQFCLDCDEFVHEMLFNCVGCQMKAATTETNSK